MKRLAVLTAAAVATGIVYMAAPAHAGHNHPHAKPAHSMDGKSMKGAMRRKHGHKKWQERDTNGDGVIDRQEYIAHATKRFERIDADNSGAISREEMHAARQAHKEKRKEMRGKMRENMRRRLHQHDGGEHPIPDDAPHS